jgi:hypothetical protein
MKQPHHFDCPYCEQPLVAMTERWGFQQCPRCRRPIVQFYARWRENTRRVYLDVLNAGYAIQAVAGAIYLTGAIATGGHFGSIEAFLFLMLCSTGGLFLADALWGIRTRVIRFYRRTYFGRTADYLSTALGMLGATALIIVVLFVLDQLRA